MATDRYRSGIVAYIGSGGHDRDTLTAERANALLAGQRLNANRAAHQSPRRAGPTRNFHPGCARQNQLAASE